MSYSLSKINPKLLRRIYRACRPTLSEPNLALNLEICDYVNNKQGSAPREAAIAVVKLISQRDPQISELAIALLDNLVKNCGYPFHLQISRKEFLNELVKRFPERPPPRYSKVQRLILAQIEEWYQTICRTSKYKDDFGYVKDMRRLLSNKGYVFPEIKVEDAAVLNPSDNLKSFEQIQKEEALVHSAKLQELIRRGKPQDLQEANKLMKIMAGFKDDNVQENRKQLSKDIAKLKRKVEILAEMLATIESSGSGLGDGHETVHELYASVKSSQPMITKIVEEDRDNEAQVQELLALNDQVNSVVQKYQLLKGGRVEEASHINVGGGSANLIDFDDDDTDAPISNNEKDNQGYNDLLSDLANLSFGGSAAPSAAPQTKNPLDLYGAGGSISLGQTATPTPQPSSGVDLLGLSSPSPQLQSNLDPFGFNFPQSTPTPVSQPAGFANTIAVGQNGALKIEVGVAAASSASQFAGTVLLSNTQSQPLDSLKFMIAVPKSCKLNLQPQSGDKIYGFSNHGVTQVFSIDNPQNKPLKIKWKAVYNAAGQHHEESGVSVLN
ncbi:ADP-ribosylation factor-binding protein Gga2p [Diutina catenulata]